MMDIIDFLLRLFGTFIIDIRKFVLVNFNGVEITLLGFIAALIIIGVTIRILMPKA